MRQTIDPTFQYDRGPVAWGAVVVVAFGLVVNFAVSRPDWLVPIAFVGGGVAAVRSDFYGTPANNGAGAVALGTLALIPVLAVARTTAVFGAEGVGETLFLSAVLALGWVLVLFVVLVPFGYLGGWIVDVTRRRVGGPIGY